MVVYLGYAKINMKKFNVKIIANNARWASWALKIQAVKDFYAPILELDITLEYSALNPKLVPYGTTAPGQLPVYMIDQAWYEANLLRAGADVEIFVVPPTDHPGMVTLFGVECGNPKGPWEITVFGSESDHVYIQGDDKGNSLSWYMIHELSHAFYAILHLTDNTHLYFNQGVPGAHWDPSAVLKELVFPPDIIPVIPSSETLLWDTQKDAYHSVRVLCDDAGLSYAKTIPVNGILYAPKDIICACIYQESRFKIQTKGPINSNGTHDWGIAQYNDGKNSKGVPLWIGPGSYFIDTAEVLANPEKCVKLMIDMYKQGHLNWWSSFSTNAYKQWLVPGSPMWGLK